MSLNFALIGCGGMANWHAQCLQKIEGVRVVGLCDTNPQSTKTFKEKYFPDAHEYTDYQQMIRHPAEKIDATVLVTPHTLHYSQGKACLRKLLVLHVLCEKPMVTRSEQAYDLWKTVKQTGKQFAITYQAPYTVEYQAIKRLREEGKMGEVQLIQGWLAQGWLKATPKHLATKPRAIRRWPNVRQRSPRPKRHDVDRMNEPVIEVACFYDKVGTRWWTHKRLSLQ